MVWLHIRATFMRQLENKNYQNKKICSNAVIVWDIGFCHFPKLRFVLKRKASRKSQKLFPMRKG